MNELHPEEPLDVSVGSDVALVVVEDCSVVVGKGSVVSSADVDCETGGLENVCSEQVHEVECCTGSLHFFLIAAPCVIARKMEIRHNDVKSRKEIFIL